AEEQFNLLLRPGDATHQSPAGGEVFFQLEAIARDEADAELLHLTDAVEFENAHVLTQVTVADQVPRLDVGHDRVGIDPARTLLPVTRRSRVDDLERPAL